MTKAEKNPEVLGLEKTIISLRAQMKLQEAEWSRNAIDLAKAVSGALIGDGKLGVQVVNQEAARKAYELAEEILKS